MRFLLYDLKRMFSGKALVLLCLISPVIVVVIFSSILAPMIYTGKGVHFNLAICDEDKSEPVREFITQMVNSQALADLVSVYPVPDVETGKALVESGDVSVLVHIPAGLFEDMRCGRKVEVSIIATKAHNLEAELISMTLNSSLVAVGESQNLLESVNDMLSAKGVPNEEADAFLSDTTSYAITQYMSRREVLGAGGSLSPLGEYLPIEYYLSAIFSIFSTLAMLPLIHLTSSDASGAIFRRGILCGRRTERFYTARILSGMVFILLVQVMVFPTSQLLKSIGSIGGVATYTNSVSALIFTMLLSSLCYSALACAVGIWLPDEKTALWTGFFLALIMAALCGALIPEGALPSWAVSIGKYLPMRAGMRTLSGALFDFNSGIFMRDAIKLLIMTAVFLLLGFCGYRRKGGSTA